MKITLLFYLINNHIPINLATTDDTNLGNLIVRKNQAYNGRNTIDCNIVVDISAH